MARAHLDDISRETITRLDLFNAFVDADRALEFDDSPFTGGLTYGYDLSKYEAPMLLPRAVRSFLKDSCQIVNVGEIRPTVDEKTMASIVFGLQSGTHISVDTIDTEKVYDAVHVNRRGVRERLGTVTAAEVGRFISGLSAPAETRKKLALLSRDSDKNFSKIITAPELWINAMAAMNNSADYVNLERMYTLRLDEVDEETFLSTSYSGILSTVLRPNGVSYALNLEVERQLEDKIKKTSMRAGASIDTSLDEREPKTHTIVTGGEGATRTIFADETTHTIEVRCNKDSATELIISFLKKASPTIPEVELVFQRGLPDIPDLAPGVDEL